jgi:hypothetical protein
VPVVCNIPVSLEAREALRRQGLGGGAEVRPETETLVRELLASVRKAHLLEPAIAYEIYTIAEISQRQLSLEGKPTVHDSLSSLLPSAKELAVAVCTVGSRLERRASDCFNEGEPLRGTLLDGIGGAAVDSLAEKFCKFVANEATSRDYEVGSPINPGMPGLPITTQPALLELVPAQEIGVSLTCSGMMIPRKSVSIIMGIGPQMARWSCAEVCARCHLKKTCAHRIPI